MMSPVHGRSDMQHSRPLALHVMQPQGTLLQKHHNACDILMHVLVASKPADSCRLSCTCDREVPLTFAGPSLCG
jgi:hypothetical protein